jgi:preprotein translocase subunit SecA
MRKILTKILGDPNAKTLKKLQPKVEAINNLEPVYKKKTDNALKAHTKELKKAFSEGKTLDDLLPEAFAAAREAARRTLGQRHFDVQLIGGMVLHEGKIAEMRTGEGKTLVATLPVYLNALAGKGVHVVTVNDYLARRDGGWMGQIYHFLGLSVGIIASGNQAFLYDPDYINPDHDDERLQHLKPVPKKEAYQADITYGTNNEFGFDYLRDNMAAGVEEMSQRELSYAIVDEVDSILIDEARTPLIISAPSATSSDVYSQFATLAKKLRKDDDFTLDEKAHAVALTDDGVTKVEKLLGVDNLYDTTQVQLIYHIEQALKAETLFKLDKDYVVRDGEVIIVDEFTGRLLPGRRYSEGLHQAIEAKEGVPVLQESVTLATISFQNYFRLYNKLAGMTGTALTEAEEFHNIYNLDVVAVPTHRPMVRQDLSDRIYKTNEVKFSAIVKDVKERNERGQPVLIGTVSIEKNEYLGQLLSKAKVPHQILNAKNNEGEANIIAKAGQKGAVTLATNIAGRGTDIVLGEGVQKLGGLHVLGSERHEARRIDNQLRGRAGRQGDPGSSQFYVSLEDDLMRVFGGERIAGLMNTLRVDEETPIENALVSRALEGAQKKVESHNFDLRKQVVQYDDVMNKHRQTIYKRRRKVLENENLKPDIINMVEAETEIIVKAHIDKTTDEVNAKEVLKQIEPFIPFGQKVLKKLKDIKSDNELANQIFTETTKIYEQREKEYGPEVMRQLEKAIYLQNLDRLWMEHLETMGHLREGIRLRAIGQRDPLVEYRKEAYILYNQLIETLEHEVVSTIFRVVPRPMEEKVESELTSAARVAKISSGKEEKQKSNTPIRKSEKIGRNDPCPCGSGRKYKKCGLIGSPEHKG